MFAVAVVAVVAAVAVVVSVVGGVGGGAVVVLGVAGVVGGAVGAVCVVVIVVVLGVGRTGLKPATKYHYRVGDPATGWSETFSFRSQDDATTIEASLPQVHLLCGIPQHGL